jgi:hypothetical protein
VLESYSHACQSKEKREKGKGKREKGKGKREKGKGKREKEIYSPFRMKDGALDPGFR